MKGKRIDKGPINVVFDSKQPLGNKEVINGISCMVCHARGMQPFDDDILKGHAATGTAAQKVTRLYPPSAEFAKVVEQDVQRFQQALSLATKRFLKGDDDILKREPVGAIARQFTTDLFFEDVAAELAHEKPETLKALFEDRAYRQFGLAVVAQGKVPRFALADSPERRGGLDLVAPGQKRDIKGYYRDDRSVDAFRIGEYSKSVAAQHLPTASESGTFTIAFRAAWKPGDPPPPNEPPQTKSVGIEAGPKREDPTELVQREIGGVRAVVKVFYGE